MEQQRTKEWFEKRKGRITGSRIGAILGLSPFSTKEDVLRDMAREWQGLPSEFTGNVATEFGTKFEPVATKDLELLLGDSIEETGFHTFEEWLGASPDGLFGSNHVIEIKCPFSKRDAKTISDFKMLKEQMHYYAQVQFEMFVTNRTQAYFYQWSPSGVDMLEEISIDNRFIEKSLKTLHTFYEHYLGDRDNKRHSEPKKQVLDDDLSLRLVTRYDQIKQEMAVLDSEKKQILDDLITMANGENAIIGGRNLTHVFKEGAISYAKAINAIAPDTDLEPYRGKPSEYWVLK